MGNLDDGLSLEHCRLCPHECGVDRTRGELGVCGVDDGFAISSIVLHQGEEPAISGADGICNVFFAHCNLQCIFCQNHQISDRKTLVSPFKMTLDEVVARIFSILDNGCQAVGFVSPSHMIVQVHMIIDAILASGRKPVFVYNSNGYDQVSSLKSLEGKIDVYLPDFKYMDEEPGLSLSKVRNYPAIAKAAIMEMYRQKGNSLILDDTGQAIQGLIIRHLVMPGYIENSKMILRWIAEELSPRINISLMSQYHPVHKAILHPVINRSLTREEYQEVVNEMEMLGFYKGWVQDLESTTNYLPDFDKEVPFQ